MRLEDELSELLAGLGVVLDEAPPIQTADGARQGDEERTAGQTLGQTEGQAGVEIERMSREHAGGDEETWPSELCLFQTSREHYGVFYRLDVVEGAPQLRIFVPDEEGAMKMRCYLVRAGADGPLCAWFAATRGHDGTAEYDDARETAQQHLLFAAGEVMKRLFWAGDLDEGRFPAEIGVRRVA